MKASNSEVGFVHHCIKIAFAIALSASFMGCAGAYVDGGVYGGAVAGPGPYFYGDFYEPGVVVHGYSHRGFASRGFAHGAGGHR
jgi:hypothetical protein